jgi:hypothetical protein
VGLSVAMGACVPVGVGVAVVDDVGDALDVGDDVGDGLDVGDGAGDGLIDPGDGDGFAEAGGEMNTLLLGEPLGLDDAEFPPVADGLPESAGPPWPLVVPGPPVWLEVLVPEGLSFSKLANVWRICPRAKTPATTRTTAPATARAGRSQVIAGPSEPRRGAPALRGHFAEAQATMPPRTGSDRSRTPAPAAASSASAPAAERDRAVLNQD